MDPRHHGGRPVQPAAPPRAQRLRRHGARRGALLGAGPDRAGRPGIGMTDRVCVVGSLNDDTTLTVTVLPSPGETTLTHGVRLTSPGGKGANQAAAAAVLGAEVAMVGAVGDDEPGERSLAALRDVGVDLTAVAVREDVGTGIAVITVDDSGENTIVVDPGANGTLTADEVTRAVTAASPAVLLVQLEVPRDAVTAAVEAAGGGVGVLNPAPVPARSEEHTSELQSRQYLV